MPILVSDRRADRCHCYKASARVMTRDMAMQPERAMQTAEAEKITAAPLLCGLLPSLPQLQFSSLLPILAPCLWRHTLRWVVTRGFHQFACSVPMCLWGHVLPCDLSAPPCPIIPSRRTALSSFHVDRLGMLRFACLRVGIVPVAFGRESF